MPNLRNPETSKNTIAGAGAGLVTSIVTCPLDVVKTRLQSQGALTNNIIKYAGTHASLKRIWSEEGIRGLYKGLGPTVCGYLPTWAIYFTAYDSLKAYTSYILDKPETSTPVHMLSALGAGGLCTAATSPLWVIKTRIMTQSPLTNYMYRNSLDAFRSILSKEGIQGFYKGLLPSMLGVTHVMIQFPLYEKLKSHFVAIDHGSVQTHYILLASSLSKAVASCLTYPHEVIRTRLQNQTVPPYKYKGLIDAVHVISKEEGFRGFYKGLTTNLLRSIPASALTLLAYELILETLT